MILCIWKCVLLLLGWLFILSMDVWFSTVSKKVLPVHQLESTLNDTLKKDGLFSPFSQEKKNAGGVWAK